MFAYSFNFERQMKCIQKTVILCTFTHQEQMSWSETAPDVLSIATFLNVTRVKPAFYIIDHQREGEGVEREWEIRDQT